MQRKIVTLLWSNQVDAAAGVGEDEICDGGGGRARATEKQREEGDDWKRENGKTRVAPIYKRRITEAARETRR